MPKTEIKNSYLEQSGYLPALTVEKFLPKAKAGVLAWWFLIFGLIFGFLSAAFFEAKSLQKIFLGATEISLGVFLLSLVYWLFLSYLQSDHEFTADELRSALAQEAFGKNLSFFAAQILDAAASRQELLLQDFFNFLLSDQRFIWILRRLNIKPETFAQEVKTRYGKKSSVSLEEVLRLAWQKAISGNHLEVDYADLIVAIYGLDEIFQKLMFDLEIEQADLAEVVYWQRRRELARKFAGRFWDRENLLDIKGIGKDWEGGYTVHLDRYARELTEEVRYRKIPVRLTGRVNEVDLLERMLLRGAGASNVVLVGPPGVGRHTVLLSFASRVNTGRTLGPLRYQRILEIDTGAILSGTASLNEVVEKINLLFGEAYLARNVILAVKDIDALFDPSAEAGRVNATEALLPFLQSPLRIIGTTTQSGYQQTIGKNPQLARLFSKLEINEPSPAGTLLILQDAVAGLERQGGLFFSHAALKEIVKLATKLIQNLPNPEKSLEVLEETATYVSAKTSDAIVLPEHVQHVLTQRTKVPVGKLAREEKQVLIDLENILHNRIVGQDHAITEVANALRRARSGIRSEKRPIGSFLFLGPTGVGKTETCKALAAVYFGSEARIIRFDMSEFQEIHAINRLIGDADARSGGLLTEAVLASPFSLVLLDEIDKAHPKILDLFLQVFDEGRLTDALGRTVSFVNALIIATSNAGAELIREMAKAGKNPALEREQILDHLQKEGIFRPEFLNRFDAVIVFEPLSQEELAYVAELLLRELNGRLNEKDIQIMITPELARLIAQKGYSAEFGARPLRRFIQENIENYIAKGLISGSIKRGQMVEIDPAML
ncbi:MAG: ATP-dependent Clp protease ATP-binding subunit [Candidatus Doudnabacteria bacterium]|nr:ATP-dependent Clp protease ATP-binding subunit [Candidatus Doudnabacteria bacterium]